MSERSPLEDELRQFVPVGAPDAVRGRIEAALGQARQDMRMARADRFLWSAMSLGAAAAVVIVSLLALDFIGNKTPNDQQPHQASVLAQTQEYMAQLAAGRDPFDPTHPQ